MLKGKTVLLGVSGGIAAYKMPNLARMLIKAGAEVHVIMTKNACEFITPFTFETLTKHKCIVDTFDKNFEYSVEHVSLAKKADLLIIAPATANVIAKLACGIADDMLTTTALACNCPKIIAPAMNTNMYSNPITFDNIQKLKHYGYEEIPPESGMLANGDIGNGRLPNESLLFDYILKTIALPHDMDGMRVLVTAGATCESIDPVRYITNHSTGKMGAALAKRAMLRGAKVTLIAGKTECELPNFVDVIKVKSAEDMYNAVRAYAYKQDIIIKAAAVADYTPKIVAEQKIKKNDGDMTIELVRTKDILKSLGEFKREGQLICGFSMETENLIENSRKKLKKKNADMIVANSISDKGAGFGVDTNIVTIITESDELSLGLLSKDAVADEILTKLIDMKG
ncbi:bifunctional phosphopantothenoylcysteine decarboxylase/phosphopantothenate--cysteine ligase CoaBC [Clostridium sp. AM09-51]|nr:bifunctional phosphopantothenoylcysteine decarboxylase/phosphopantothenate--cysteine ligase CoaBC [Clostridium sp. AM09-51]